MLFRATNKFNFFSSDFLQSELYNKIVRSATFCVVCNRKLSLLNCSVPFLSPSVIFSLFSGWLFNVRPTAVLLFSLNSFAARHWAIIFFEVNIFAAKLFQARFLSSNFFSAKLLLLDILLMDFYFLVLIFFMSLLLNRS